MMPVAFHAGTVTEPVQRSMTREIETDIGNVTENETKIVVVILEVSGCEETLISPFSLTLIFTLIG